MTPFSCTRIASLLAARTAGLPEAHALRLEEHLAHCQSCSEQARMLDGLRELSDVTSSPLPAATRQRTILAALAAAERPAPRTAAPEGWFVPSFAGAALAALLVVWGILRAPDLGSEASARVRVLSGQLERSVVSDASGASDGRMTALATDAGAAVALAHANLELRAGVRARWDDEHRVFRLERGSVVADVDPSRHLSFEIATERFRVLVLGTRFEVSLDRVSVIRGRVQVVAADGTSLAMLDPGESYACSAAPCAAEPVARQAAVQAPSALALVEGDAPAEDSNADAASSADHHVPSASRAHLQPIAAARRLEAARLALAGRDFARARSLVAEVLASDISTRERAEALSLRAECALVARDFAGAVAGYRLVAERFGNLPAGENAAFAAARIDADRFTGKQAEQGLAKYLARYPNGRFVKEATARLRELRSGSHPQP